MLSSDRLSLTALIGKRRKLECSSSRMLQISESTQRRRIRTSIFLNLFHQYTFLSLLYPCFDDARFFNF